MTFLATLSSFDADNQYQNYSIIMDRADATLSDLVFISMGKYTPPSYFRITLKTLLAESSALAGALQFLHEGLQFPDQIAGCCHMDLKPDNIFVFYEPDCPVGRWKIADFGISAIRELKNSTVKVAGVGDDKAPQDSKKTIETKWKRGPGPYVAPEVSRGSEKVGRTSDIWSYGCILVDIIASRMTEEASVESLKRTDGLETSHPNYTTQDYFFQEPELNPRVQNWLEDLNKTSKLREPHDSAALNDCQDLLKQMLNVDPDRPSAKVVRERLIVAHRHLDPITEDAYDVAEEDHVASDRTPAPIINLSALKKAFSPSIRALSHFPNVSMVTADAGLLEQIKSWLRNDSIETPLWVDILQAEQSMTVSSFCVGLLKAAKDSDVFATYHMCSKTLRQSDTSDASLAESSMRGLYDLVASLIYQLHQHLIRDSNYRSPVTQARFDTLNLEKKPLSTAIAILGDLWQVVPRRWICIIDMFDDVEVTNHVEGEKMTSNLLKVIYPGFRRQDVASGTETLRPGCKTLITTRQRSMFLVGLPGYAHISIDGSLTGPEQPVCKFFESTMKRFSEPR